jgi:hypothetical protein
MSTVKVSGEDEPRNPADDLFRCPNARQSDSSEFFIGCKPGKQPMTARSSRVVTNQDDQTVAIPRPVPPDRKITKSGWRASSQSPMARSQLAQYRLGMSHVLTHPLFVLLVGVAFSAGLVPWVTRRWQDKQRALDIRTGLVAEMSDCVMKFVAKLEHFHSPHQSTQGSAALGSSECQARSDALPQCYSKFHVARCIIGTKLEVYYPEKVKGEEISRAWKDLADWLTRLYHLSCRDDNKCNVFKGELLDIRLCRLREREKLDAIKAAERPERIVNEVWGRPEQLLLAEKARLIRAVLRTHVSLSGRPRRFHSTWRRFWEWATIMTLRLCMYQRFRNKYRA